MSVARKFEELEVYNVAFDLQQRLFELSKPFPAEERYSLTDQLRRASRSIGANIAEAWQKRRYVAHFQSKLTDADAEQAETRHWITTATRCGYISVEKSEEVLAECRRVGGMLGSMIQKADLFCRAPSLSD